MPDPRTAFLAHVGNDLERAQHSERVDGLQAIPPLLAPAPKPSRLGNQTLRRLACSSDGTGRAVLFGQHILEGV